MTPSDLDARLKKAVPPDPGPVYWHEFASRVTAGIRRTSSPTTPTSPPPEDVRTGFPTLAAALGMAVLFAAVPRLFLRSTDPLTQDPGALSACFEEAAALFPGRLRSIVEDRDGLRMDLAESATFVGGPRVFLIICGPAGCSRFVTSSGQQIRIADRDYDVLVDGRGAVLVAGPQVLWSSANPHDEAAGFRIAARVLEPRT